MKIKESNQFRSSKFRWAVKKQRKEGKDLSYSLESFEGCPLPRQIARNDLPWGQFKPILNQYRSLIAAAVVSYKRDNGKEKYVLRIPTVGFTSPDLDDLWVLLHFDTFLVVDTNTISLNSGKFRSVSSAARFSRNGREFIQVWEEVMNFDPAEHLEPIDRRLEDCTASDIAKPAEKFGIIKLIEGFKNDQTLGKTAIVTDSDMGLHPAFNYRQMALLAEQPVLPENFTLIYASSDASTAHEMCGLMAERDRAAKADLKCWLAALSHNA